MRLAREEKNHAAFQHSYIVYNDTVGLNLLYSNVLELTSSCESEKALNNS